MRVHFITVRGMMFIEERDLKCLSGKSHFDAAETEKARWEEWSYRLLRS